MFTIWNSRSWFWQETGIALRAPSFKQTLEVLLGNFLLAGITWLCLFKVWSYYFFFLIIPFLVSILPSPACSRLLGAQFSHIVRILGGQPAASAWGAPGAKWRLALVGCHHATVSHGGRAHLWRGALPSPEIFLREWKTARVASAVPAVCAALTLTPQELLLVCLSAFIFLKPWFHCKAKVEWQEFRKTAAYELRPILVT